jgi:hypothetical protein
VKAAIASYPGPTFEFAELIYPAVAAAISLGGNPNDLKTFIPPVLNAKRPGFERKRLSRLHALPKALGCEPPILRVDCAHPGLRMRPDEIECLTSELKPNSIHEFRGPVRLERPGGYGELLQQFNL